MNTSILAVGTELLFGQTINSNAAYLSDKLNHMGFNVLYHHVVGDNPERLRVLLQRALEESDLVILTGGLGPTQDDLTKEIVAEVFGAALQLDEDCLREIRAYFEERGRRMTSNNIKQAYIPKGASVFSNERGTAPAFAIEQDGKCAICLPGPPHEMQGLFERHVARYLHRFMDKEMVYRIVRTIGIGESDLETRLLPLIDGQQDPTLATYAKEGECTLRIASQRDTREEAEQAVQAMLAAVEELIGEFIYSCDDEALETVVVHELAAAGLTLASAESCTGGRFAASITDVPGASAVFSEGFVSYSAAAKVSLLGVPEALIREHSVVSDAVAVAMATGARSRAGSDVAISITGYAGPEADPGREPGEAYIGYSCGGKLRERSGSIAIETKRNHRAWNRNFFRLRMLLAVHEILQNRR